MPVKQAIGGRIQHQQFRSIPRVHGVLSDTLRGKVEIKSIDTHDGGRLAQLLPRVEVQDVKKGLCLEEKR
ncbi:MAG: hypothetical protein BWY17_02314 [Deltaproteobacteria bacterium ADurb.Bin207]|nr:MAG: hypothetical protein BWY17_02314 [Deltaproteobacteria bacterium ADurb.Bin207]